jgi:hypothetical protein
MFDVEAYRANANHCLRMAEDPLNWKNRRTWLNMAVTWLGMIPQSKLRPEETFEGLSESGPTHNAANIFGSGAYSV